MLATVWFAVVLLFFSIPSSKLVGYVFPALPAFAILVSPWFASYRHQITTAVIGGLICICAVLVAAYMATTGPVRIATKNKSLIAADDEVVFLGKYFFDVAVVLDQTKPIYITGDWSRRADELPDSIRRQLTEGREFESRSGYILIGPGRTEVRLSSTQVRLDLEREGDVELPIQTSSA